MGHDVRVGASASANALAGCCALVFGWSKIIILQIGEITSRNWETAYRFIFLTSVANNSDAEYSLSKSSWLPWGSASSVPSRKTGFTYDFRLVMLRKRVNRYFTFHSGERHCLGKSSFGYRVRRRPENTVIEFNFFLIGR